ncbi:VOC family protein [Paenibacillus rhizovicinus]|uniref:VOC family protein n=1 Tax=Paenibacillus rhizovicinus TaxID=2704463 RepID=A0A6C0NUL4_9BACL|nr:VOC family protein [Paenibacillus rhizovicinus]QHW29801.1 VOC family protein [Paenibacillus rhizovicinus]
MTEQQSEKLVERIDAVFLPVRDLGKAVDWYSDIFGLETAWRNKRFAGLIVGSNVGFHLVEVKDYVANQNYCPFNFAAADLDSVRAKLEGRGVVMTGYREGEPRRFDFFDLDGNILTIIQIE